MAYTETEYEYRNLNAKELSEYARWKGKAEDAQSVGDHGYAGMAYDEMERIRNQADKRELESIKKQTKEEVYAIMKLPASRRNEYYAKVKKERGSEAAVALVHEVKKHIRLNMEMER